MEARQKSGTMLVTWSLIVIALLLQPVPSNGDDAALTLHLVLSDSQFVQGSPFEVAIYIVNNGSGVALLPSNEVSLSWPPLNLSVKSETGNRYSLLRFLGIHGKPFSLQRGDTIGGVFDLGSRLMLNGQRAFPLPPGSYTARAVLQYEAAEIGKSELTDTASFNVRKASGEDSVALELLEAVVNHSWHDNSEMYATLDSIIETCPGSPVRESAYLRLLGGRDSMFDGVRSQRLLRLMTHATIEYPNSLLLWQRIRARRLDLDADDLEKLDKSLELEVPTSMARLALRSDRLPMRVEK